MGQLLDVKDKRAIVTGSGGGLGKAFALRLLEAGAHVCISDVDEDLGVRTAAEFKARFGSGRVHFKACDVTKMDEVVALFEEAEERLPKPASALAEGSSATVDILVNNAGVMGQKEGWAKCVDVNLIGVLNGCSVALDRAGPRGATVVNVASILGLFCAHQPKGWAYNTSKTGAVAASRCMAADASFTDKSVRILCLCPSVTTTPILLGCSASEIEQMRKDVGGFLDPETVADAFMELLQRNETGSVMAVWKDCPPYLIPDTSMAIFIVFTALAMVFRYVPGFATPKVIRPWPHMVACCVPAVLLLWYLLASSWWTPSFSP